MIEIRPALWADLPELRRLAIETQWDTFGEANTYENMTAFIDNAFNLFVLQTEFKEKDSSYTMAWEGDIPVGFLRVRKTQEADAWLGNNNLELQRIYVARDFQGKKVGARLMRTAIDFAKARQYDWLWLGVWEHNFPAQDFYKKWGFERFSQHVFQMGNDPQTDWLLKLKL